MSANSSSDGRNRSDTRSESSDLSSLLSSNPSKSSKSGRNVQKRRKRCQYSLRKSCRHPTRPPFGATAAARCPPSARQTAAHSRRPRGSGGLARSEPNVSFDCFYDFSCFQPFFVNKNKANHWLTCRPITALAPNSKASSGQSASGSALLEAIACGAGVTRVAR